MRCSGSGAHGMGVWRIKLGQYNHSGSLMNGVAGLGNCILAPDRHGHI